MYYKKITTMSDVRQTNEKCGKITRFYYNETRVDVVDYNGEKQTTKKQYMYDCVECYNGTPTYETMVDFLISLKYSKSEENAILRKKIANIDTSNEFDDYNAYAEECKTLAKELLELV